MDGLIPPDAVVPRQLHGAGRIEGIGEFGNTHMISSPMVLTSVRVGTSRG